RFGGSGYYLKSADEMRAVDTSDLWQAGCRNTLLVAERVDTSGMFEFHNLMPKFPVPEGETEESYFRAEVARGMARRFPDGLDELPHGLIFERFLNPDRVSMPDIDIDFDERRRGDVIRYVTERWGEDRVAQIATFGTIKAKAAIKDSARVLGFPFAVGDKIT